MKSIKLMAAVVLLATSVCQAQINNASTETVKVFGNCGMCKTAIEKAAQKKKVSKAEWNEATKMASITYDNQKTSLDAVLKNIALVGYDNQHFLAPDAAYDKLPECCKYNRENKHMAVIQQPMMDSVAPRQHHGNHPNGNVNNAVQEANPLEAVLDGYFALKDALVKTDGNTAAAKAKDLQAAIQAVKMDKLSMAVHTVWMDVFKSLKEDATYISGTKKISSQRDRFMGLSKNMYEVIKIAKPVTPVYYQFCPMANNGKGANWLSKESGVRNPYYGSQMLTCGSTVETIKQ